MKVDKKLIRTKKRIKGTSERPRLCVYRSQKHIYAQIINDENGKSLVAKSSLSSEFKKDINKGWNIEAAKKVGELVAKDALQKGIKEVMFDRNGYVYYGRISALADAARKNGLVF
ncbi:MAG: 50S ribosomal protein L18 [bacterium]